MTMTAEAMKELLKTPGDGKEFVMKLKEMGIEPEEFYDREMEALGEYPQDLGSEMKEQAESLRKLANQLQKKRDLSLVSIPENLKEFDFRFLAEIPCRIAGATGLVLDWRCKRIREKQSELSNSDWKERGSKIFAGQQLWSAKRKILREVYYEGIREEIPMGDCSFGEYFGLDD